LSPSVPVTEGFTAPVSSDALLVVEDPLAPFAAALQGEWELPLPEDNLFDEPVAEPTPVARHSDGPPERAEAWESRTTATPKTELSVLPSAIPSLAPPACAGACPPSDSRDLGTALLWAQTPEEAAERAKDEGKLVFLIHVSGNFESPGFT
jgi:hypothetical protein